MSAETSTDPLRLARSALYVPGDAVDKLGKALDRGADEVIVDLEDAVVPDRKDHARALVADWLREVSAGSRPDVAITVRINAGVLGRRDLAAVADAPALAGVVLAKAESLADVIAADKALTAVGSAAGVVPLLESGLAVLRAAEIAAGPRVLRLQVGEADLRAELGVTLGPDERELLHVRSHVVLVSSAVGIAPPIAPVSTDFRDLTALRASTEAMARLGFVGRACIHPAQVAVVNEVFTPSAEQVAEAEDVLAVLAAAGSGIAVDGRGRMVDEAVARQARSVLARAHR